MRLVHVSNGPLPYHTPILNELDSLVDLHVIYMSTSHPLGSFVDLWGSDPRYEYETYWSLPATWRRVDFRAQLSLGVSRRLSQLNPDTVLVISWGPLSWEPLVWCRRSRARTVMWSESTAFSGLLRGRASNSFRRALVSLADAVVTESSSATSFVRQLGATKVVTSCLPSPNAPTTIGAPERDHAASISYLFVGRLIARKRPLDAVGAFLDVMDELPGSTLTVVGDGPLLDAVVHASRGGAGRIEVLPRLEGRRLSRVYARSDVLVVPSQREGWGLVVNEALAHGLYVVATDEVASAIDLLEPGRGRVVRAGDRRALATALLEAGTVVRHGLEDRVARARDVSHCTAARFATDIARAATLAWSES